MLSIRHHRLNAPFVFRLDVVSSTRLACAPPGGMSIDAKLGIVVDDPRAEHSRMNRVRHHYLHILASSILCNSFCNTMLKLSWPETWVNVPGLKLACDWLLKRARVPNGVLCPHALTFSSHADHGLSPHIAFETAHEHTSHMCECDVGGFMLPTSPSEKATFVFNPSS